VKIVLDTDKLTVPQLYALSWMVFDQPKIHKQVVDEHNWRAEIERQENKRKYESHNEG
jgi:hypothetical protein